MVLLFASGKTHPRGAFFALLEHYGVIFYKKKAHPGQNFISVKDELLYTRGATLLHGMTHALCEIPAYFRQLTYALRRRILNILNIFPCALCGPFDNLHFHPALTFPDSLWVHN